MFRWTISVLCNLFDEGKTYVLIAALDIKTLHFLFNTGEFSMEWSELQYSLFLRNWKMQRWPREQRTFLQGCSMRTRHPQSKWWYMSCALESGIKPCIKEKIFELEKLALQSYCFAYKIIFHLILFCPTMLRFSHIIVLEQKFSCMF